MLVYLNGMAYFRVQPTKNLFFEAMKYSINLLTRIFFVVVFLFGSMMVEAQTERGNLRFKVEDALTHEGVSGAVVTLIPQRKGVEPVHVATGWEGKCRVSALRYGTYVLKISFLGYEEYWQEVELKTQRLDLGVISLKEGVEIEAVVKEVKALRTSTRGDTVSYNANAFKVVADADVEGLIRKMPGITVTDGVVEAQGEEVKRVLIDGREFFGEDVTTAIKSLPAEMVERVEVYNKLSDAAEFSGMDDGEGYKALNIVTRPNMKNGKFGKIYAGFGYDADTKDGDKFRYLAGGNVNFLHGDSRVSVIGLFNNVNQQNFSFEDILGVVGDNSGGHHKNGVGQFMIRPQKGVAQVNALGVDYSDVWGKDEKVKISASYFFNNTDTKNHHTLEKWHEAPIYRPDTLMTMENSKVLGYNHRFNARLDWKISPTQSLMLRPQFSYQSNEPLSRTLGWRFGAPEMGGSGYSRTDSYNNSSRSGYMVGTGMVYRLRLGKPGRTLTLDAFGRYADNSNEAHSWSNRVGSVPVRPEILPQTGEWDTEYIDPETGEVKSYVGLRYLSSDSPSFRYNVRGRMVYSEPLAENWQMSLQYNVSYENEERDKKAYTTGEDFSIQGLEPDAYLSNSYKSNYLKHNVGPGVKYSKNRNTFIATVKYQNSTLRGESVNARISGDPKLRKSFDDVTYFLMGRLNVNKEHTLRLYISSYTWKPAVADLQNIYNISNLQHIRHGNPTLNPAYSHSIRFHYTHTNIEKGRTFMWAFYFQAIQDYKAVHTVQTPGVIHIDERTYSPDYYSTPINMDGFHQLRNVVSYGFPIGFLKSNLNLSLGINYSLTPSMFGGQVMENGLIAGGEKTENRNMGYHTRAVLGSNISEKVDFTLSWDGTYNTSDNETGKQTVHNRYFNHKAHASMKFVLPLDFTFTASVLYRQYIGFTNDYDDDFTLCNLWIGKKIFRNHRGEIMFGVNDVFNQNKGFHRSTGSGWTQNALNSVVGRYYMVQFTLNLRHFGKKGASFNGDLKEGKRHHRHPYGGGHPHGMYGRGYEGMY